MRAKERGEGEKECEERERESGEQQRQVSEREEAEEQRQRREQFLSLSLSPARDGKLTFLSVFASLKSRTVRAGGGRKGWEM